MTAQFSKAVFNAAEEAVESSEVCQPRTVHEWFQPFAQDACEVFAEELAFHRVD